LRPLAPGLTPRSALEKFAVIQMVDVHRPTTDGRTLVLSEYSDRIRTPIPIQTGHQSDIKADSIPT
ncbi:hypothetical protein, partial [uncultured Thiocystis sp.]|uniref:hypothetical protein n=1 Tax=uncultured Thiocystis sp. TaxID=1202134 RepID=UPI0025D8CEDD